MDEVVVKVKNIIVSPEVHERLVLLKVHPREPFNDVIERILPKSVMILEQDGENENGK